MRRNQRFGSAYELARALALRGVTVWSGGALGIGAAAPRSSRRWWASIAVVATGLHHCSPPNTSSYTKSWSPKGVGPDLRR